MATQTYRDPKTGKIYTQTGEHIADLNQYKQRVISGELAPSPREIPTTQPQAKPQDVVSRIGSLGEFQSNAKFLQTAEDIIRKKQSIATPLTEQKAYWRTLIRDTSPFGEVRAPEATVPGGFNDPNFRLLNPQQQASVRASRDAAAMSHLQGIAEEEKYRGERIEDLMGKTGEVLKEKRELAQQKLDKQDNELANRLKMLQIKTLEGETGWEFDESGALARSQYNSTAQAVAGAIRTAEGSVSYDYSDPKRAEKGAYQFMPNTWASWSSEYLKSIGENPNQTLAMTKENQDAVAEWKIQGWLDQGYSPKQIAALWNSGKPEWKGRKGTSTITGEPYDVEAYVGRFSKALDNILPRTQTTKHKAWTEAAVKELAIKTKKSFTDLWNNYTDDQLIELASSVGAVSNQWLADNGPLPLEEINKLSSQDLEVYREVVESEVKGSAKGALGSVESEKAMGEAQKLVEQLQARDKSPMEVYTELSATFEGRLSENQIMKLMTDNGYGMLNEKFTY